jgi:hypothetical protein
MALDLEDPPIALHLAHQIELSESLSFVIARTTIAFRNAMERFFDMFAAARPSKFLTLLANHT